MTEAKLVTALIKIAQERLPSSVVFKHSDQVTAGIPDISVTWRKTTLWLEVKLVAPTLYLRPLQDLMMKRLNRTSHARYVIFQTDPPRTLIVKPGLDITECEMSWPGIDPTLVIDYLKEKWPTSN